MKKLITGVMALAVLAFVSCESKTKLAEEIEGTWASGTPEKLGASSDNQMSIIEVYNFTKNPDTTGGSLIIQAMISARGSVNPDGEIVQPYELSEAAVASAQGAWNLVDDDEIQITIDPMSISVNVDPDAVAFRDDVFTDEQSAAVDSIRPEVAKFLQQTISKEMTERFSNLTLLDDVKVKGNLLKYEIGKKHYIMSKQEAEF